MADWLSLLDDCLAAAGGLDGTETPRAATPSVVSTRPSPTNTTACRRRDERFPDPYNMGVNAEVFLYDEKFPPEPKTLMMFYKRLREIDVPEMMASIITETPGKPWDYYRDMTRQLWDEARHAMMGEVGFVDLGIDWPKQVMVNYTWSLAPQHAAQADRTPRRALLHRAGAHAEDRQALRVGSRPRLA